MKSKSKLNIGRVNKATLERIRDLREALIFLEANPNSTKGDVEAKFRWSASKCSKVVLSLVKCGLAKVSGTTPGKAPSKLYSALPHTEEDLARELPIDIPMSKTSGRSDDAKPQPKIVSEWKPGEATRDPLTAALMGSGVAPSLTFDQRYAAYDRIGVNFMDSAKGG